MYSTPTDKSCDASFREASLLGILLQNCQQPYGHIALLQVLNRPFSCFVVLTLDQLSYNTKAQTVTTFQTHITAGTCIALTQSSPGQEEEEPNVAICLDAVELQTGMTSTELYPPMPSPFGL